MPTSRCLYRKLEPPIPDHVWGIRDQKVGFKRRVRFRAKLWADVLCRAFLQWKEEQDYSVLVLLGKQSLLYELAAAAVKFSTARIRRDILRAKQAFLQQVAGEGHHGAAKVLQRVKRAGVGGSKARPISRPLPMLLHPETGTAVTTRKQRDQVWMLHFGQQEQGHTMPVVDFLEAAQWSCYDGDVSWDISYLPSYLDIEQVLREIPRNKAAGLDNIPGEVLKAAPSAAAKALFPLFIKSMLQQHQPVQWRGGMLYEAFKRSGLQSSVDNYRSLFVSSYVAKAYHRVVRNKTQQHSRDELHPLHFGSKKRAPVTFAALFVLSHFRRCHDRRRSAAVLYLDTSAAYYRIVRELAVGDIRADDTVLRLFHRFGLDGDDVQDLLETVRHGGMLAQAGAPDALRQVVKDLHLHTWFVSRFSDGTEICNSFAGSRPGESWADLIYAYIYGRVLHKVHEHARAEGLTFSVVHDPAAGVFPQRERGVSIPVTDATWADDFAFPLEHESPQMLLSHTRRLCTLVISFCEGHGMAPNLKPGKTSVMLHISGRGSHRARQAYFRDGAKSLSLPDLGVSVVVADSYKHLGGVIDSKLTMRPEARFRLAQASSSYDAAKTLLLGNPRLDLITRARLFESVVTPTFFNIGLWLPAGKAWEALRSGYSKLVRRLLVPTVGAHQAFHLPLPVAHWCTGCWHIELVARRARLSLLLSLVQVGPPLLWAMLQEEGQWCRVLRDDLSWFVQPDPEQWPALHASAWDHWSRLLCQSAHRFRSCLKKRLRQAHDTQCRADAGLLCQWHCYRTLTARQPAATTSFTWTCHVCSKSFGSKAALGVHFFKVHGRVAEYRHVAQGTTCEACSTCFWTPGRLAAHLRASPGCVVFLQQAGKRADQIAPGFGSKRRRHSESQDYTLSLPLRQGAIPGPVQDPIWGQECRAAYTEVCDSIFSVTDASSFYGVHQILTRALSQRPLYPDEISTICDFVAGEINQLQADDPHDPWEPAEAQKLLSALEQVGHDLLIKQDLSATNVGHRYSLLEFQSLLDSFDWHSQIGRLPIDGTHTALTFPLLPRWEAEWRQQCSRVGISAVIEDIGVLLPDFLRQAWQALLQGRTVAIHAPPDFWHHPLARPFICLRAVTCKP